jgi:hypothetical protein
MTALTFLFILVFLIGLYFYSKGIDPKYAEGLTNNASQTSRCPNLLIQKGSNYFLYNSKVAQVPGINPIVFENLEDYTEFLDWQRSQGVRCPVLYLQETYDAQGTRVYKARPSVSEPQAGLPPSASSSSSASASSPSASLLSSSSNIMVPSSASPIGIGSQLQPPPLDQVGDVAYPNPTLLVDATRNDPPYNKNSYPGYDQTDYYVGTTTPLDGMNYKQEKASVSPDPMDPNWGGAEYTQSLVDKGYYKENNVSIYVD